MRETSQRLQRAVTGSHVASFRAKVLATFQTGTQPEGTEIPILDGDVTASASADVRATLALDTDAAWANDQGALLAPYGNEVYVERGVRIGNETEWVGLGYYRIEDVEQDDAPKGVLRLAGKDRMAGIVEARLLAPRQFQADDTVLAVVGDLVNEVYPGAVLDLDADLTTSTLGRSVVVDQDRFRFLRDLATARGKVMYWDYRGAFRMTSPPDAGDVTWTISTGEGGTLVRLQRSMSRDPVYNAVVAVGEGPDTNSPVRAVAVDLNPDSPTYWHGRFGKKPRFFNSPLLTELEQAQDASAKLLRRMIGLPYSVALTAVPNPALEPLDPGEVITSHGPERHVLQTVTIPLVAEQAMTGSTREQTDIQIGAL